MNVLIVEDESLAARRLQKMVQELEPSAQVLTVLDSVAATVHWLQQHSMPDLLLLDIELVDGQSFEIFSQTEVRCPVIFTTAYDEYALRAFKVHSIDYLLKPIQEKELQQSLQKFRQLARAYAAAEQPIPSLTSLLEALKGGASPAQPHYRDRILVKQGQRMFPILTADIAYFFTRDKLTQLRTSDNRQYLLDYTLEELERSLNPKQFYRANRQYIVALGAVQRLHLYFNSKLKLELRPAPEEEVLVSREKALDFRNWLGE
ncbi:LytR/AlgR family response regulator transcription factor [Cesiribacter andamanensis]|uniref:Putative transcriptional regulatory protein YehT n=1 Tax=Cesiribacter andamanensis AMV16 TaxID=1279009 RepID=M7MXT0_9BACT|nr:LytTR family DNA-binding domain-containing protein [Cesiribacter andamanensis]EMR01248.1 putative transcriptional regulatory protein YehT [Cesiribacter andamanensis AMV16]